ncbi:hypothetical protein [Methylomonas sp. AM2-LC]|uniref:hypothetical protein n=1 Tax=Methylomonas sp. AM2-LC TaxID=3153301 RepID=UPI00326595BD
MQIHKLTVLVMLICSFAAQAEVPLSRSDILGTWQIDKESMHSDGSNGKASNATWTFKEDGTMEGISQDADEHARVTQLRASLNYSIENGKILKQAAAGRSKMETCMAVEKEASKMVLKCQTVFFFMTKK